MDRRDLYEYKGYTPYAPTPGNGSGTAHNSDMPYPARRASGSGAGTGISTGLGLGLAPITPADGRSQMGGSLMTPTSTSIDAHPDRPDRRMGDSQPYVSAHTPTSAFGAGASPLSPLQADRYGKQHFPQGPSTATLPPLSARYDTRDIHAQDRTRAYGEEYAHGSRGDGYEHAQGPGYPQTAVPLGHHAERGWDYTDKHRDGERARRDWRDVPLPASTAAASTSLRLQPYRADNHQQAYAPTPSSKYESYRNAPLGSFAGLGGAGLHGASRRASDTRSADKLSPTKIPAKRTRGDESDSESDDADKEDKSKLEIKREKNRVKQRNLRLRRANLISDLESNNHRLTDENASLEARTTELSRKSTNLEQYVADLEAVLAEAGFEREMKALKSAWTDVEYLGRDAAGVARGSVSSSTSSAGAAAVVLGAMPPPQTSRLPPRGSGATSMSPTKHDIDHLSAHIGTGASMIPRRISTGSMVPSTSYFDSPMQGLTPTTQSQSQTQTPGTVDIAPSPRSLRIEDLLSPSVLGPSPPISGPSGTSIEAGFHLARDPIPGDSSDERVSALVPADMPEFIPLNLDFKVEPWMMEDWLHCPIMELGEPMLGNGTVEGVKNDDAWDLLTVEDGMSFDKQEVARRDHSRPTQLHPCVHIARKMLKSIIPESNLPVTEWRLHSLEPVQQRILLSALSQLGNPDLRNEIARQQIDTLPPGFVKVLLQYQLDPTHDLRLMLMPIAILRARVIQFGKQGLEFDLTKFITHVLADARVFGDVGDADSWELSQPFWDVWEGWFPVARRFCSSLQAHRRRYGHPGSTPLEIIMGTEQVGARMAGRVGKPPGWAVPPAVVQHSEQTE